MTSTPPLVFSQSYRVRPAEVDATDHLTLPALLDLFQDLAGQHAEALGLGMDRLRETGTAWVLNRMVFEAGALPRTGADVRIETWPSGTDRLYAWRDAVVFDAGGHVVARGTTRWLTIHIETRRPRRMDEGLERLVPQRPPALVLPDRAAALFEAAAMHVVLVRHADLDVNGHANNVQYARWFVEALDDGFLGQHRQTGLDVTVRAETRRGDVLRSEASPPDADGRVLHRLVREGDGREVAAGWTRWAAR